MSSQQQCLPLPGSCRKRNRRDASVNNNNNNNDESDHDKITTIATPQHIHDLQEIDAMNYLASVSAQASELPFVFVAEKSQSEDIEINNNHNAAGYEDTMEDTTTKQGKDEEEAKWDGSVMSVQYLFSKTLKLIPPPTIHHLPPIVTSKNENEQQQNVSMQEYANLILDNFSKLRLYLHQCRSSSNNMLRERKIAVPMSKDEYKWNLFCVGKDGDYYDMSSSSSSCSCSSSVSDVDKNESIQENDKTQDERHNSSYVCSPKFDERLVPENGYEPTTSLLCQLDQIIVRRVIKHHIQYMTKNGCDDMSKKRGKWIYALLARLEKPLHRDEASSLTTLLRELCRMRSELNADDLLSDNSHGDCEENLHRVEFEDSDLKGKNSAKRDEKFTAKKKLALFNTLIVIIGIYFEQCHSLDSIMKLEE